nr:alpha/beta hydrolase [Patulibacter sp. SYSU D01012]
MEGGPGYPATGTSAEYRAMYGPLLRRRDLLLVDMRGTGSSGLIDCRALQGAGGRQSGSAFARRVARCGRALNRAYPDGRGGRLHASDLFSTKLATDDLDAVLGHLRRRSIDLYGDSYGTFFVQSFVSRHRERLHSVVLDSAYPVRDLDPFYASSVTSGLTALDRVCARSVACTDAAGGGTASARLAALVARTRTAPLRGTTRAADGTRVRATVGPRQLADLMQDAGSDALILRELDAAVRAALAGDAAPLLRLAVQARAYDHGAVPASYFSYGLYWATACTDYPQLFDMRATPAQRRRQLAAAKAAAGDARFAPFAVGEWTAISGYSQPFDGCLSWPAPVRRDPVVGTPDVPLPADVPLLVLGGDLDSLTPVADAQAFAARVAVRHRVVPVHNGVHVPALGNDVTPSAAACAARLVRAFVRRPDALERLDASCAPATEPIHTPGAYPRRFADVAPATGTGDETARRAATVAAGVLGDATVRYRYSEGAASTPALRGGTVRAAGEERVRLTFDGARLVADAPVDGTGTWEPASGAVRGALTVRVPGGRPVRVRVAWNVGRPTATARVGGATLELPAP